MKNTLYERRQILIDNVLQKEGYIMRAQYKDCKTNEEIDEYLDASVNEQCEGLMVKTLHVNST